MLQVSDVHEGAVEVVKLKDAGQQKEARDEGAGEELGDAELLQTQVTQPGREGILWSAWGHLHPLCHAWASSARQTFCASVSLRVMHLLAMPWCHCTGGDTMAGWGHHGGMGTPRRDGDTHCSLVRPVRFLQYMGKSSNWKV